MLGKLAATGVAVILGISSASVLASTNPNKVPATDRPSSYVLAHAVQRFDQGRLPGESPNAAIHRNFPQLIEQNFARLDANGARRLIDNLKDRELVDLAKLYKSAAADGHHQERLLAILAHRLDTTRLARLAGAFGYLPVYRAVQEEVPSIATKFSSAMTFAAPEPELALGVGGGAIAMAGSGIGQYLNMTPYEIYMDFRTLPVGSLGVGGALFESAAIVGAWGWLAYRTGSKIGSDYVDPLIQTYDPELWDAIGGTIDVIVDQWTTATQGTSSSLRQSSQSNMGNTFANPNGGCTSAQVNNFEYFGGDNATSYDWMEFVAGGSGGSTCPVRFCTNPGDGND